MSKNKNKNKSKDTTKIQVKMPCKCIIEVDRNKINTKINKAFIDKIECDVHNVGGKDVFLKKNIDGTYRAVLKMKDERKIFKEEDDFFVEMYNKKVCKCSECDADIYGKHMLSVNHLKRFIWDIDYKCPNCGLTDVSRIDTEKLEN